MTYDQDHQNYQDHQNHEPPPPPASRRMPPPPPPPSASAGQGWTGNFLQSCVIAGCVTVFVPILLVGGLFLMLGLVLSRGLEESAANPFRSLVQSANGNIREQLLRPGDADAGTVAVINIHGAIDGSGSPIEGTGALSYVSEQLRAARDDEDVKAVILQIDSPGGGLSASDFIHHEVELLRAGGTPVLAWAGGMMASGGYYIAAAAEEIMASPTATIGSIGVIMQHFQVKELLGKIGVKVDPITSTEHKDMGSPFRDMTPEERKILQDYIAQAHQRFVDIVAKGRDMPVERVRDLADGTIFGPEEARRKGLVDSVGYIEDAIAWAEKKTGGEKMRVIGYKRLISLGDLFSEAGRGAASALVEAAAKQEAPPKKAMAVWR